VIEANMRLVATESAAPQTHLSAWMSRGRVAVLASVRATPGRLLRPFFSRGGAATLLSCRSTAAATSCPGSSRLPQRASQFRDASQERVFLREQRIDPASSPGAHAVVAGRAAFW